MNRIIKNIFGNRFKNIDAYKIKKIKIDLRDITTATIRLILSKLKEEKTSEDIAILKNYILLKTKFIEKLTQDHIDENMQEIIVILSMLDASYKEIKYKDEIIYNINDKNDYFHIILEGGVSLLGIEQIDCEMNSEDYYKLILNYRKNNEKYLLERTLKENKINFPIDLEDIPILDKILVKTYILFKSSIESLNNNPNYLEIILNKVGLSFNDVGIEAYEDKLEEYNNKILLENELKAQEKEEKEEKGIKNIHSNEKKEVYEYNINEAMKYAKQNEQIILEKLKFIVPDALCKKYYYLICTPELSVSYFKYKEEKTLQALDYFGDNEKQLFSHRYISNRENTSILNFRDDIYNEILSTMKTKFVGNQVDFLLNNFFFSSIYKGFFDKIYLKYFEYSKYYVNQIILEENEPIKYIYFVKTGAVRLYSKRSIIQNHILIEVIKNILKKKNMILLLDDPKAFDLDLTLYPDLKADFELIKNEIKLKNDIHLMTYQEKQCIGFECFYFGFNSLYTAQAISDKVELYKISIEKLVKILSIKNKKALYDFAQQSEKTIKILLDRIIIMNNKLLEKYSKQNKELVHQISTIFEKAINIIQAKNSEIKSRKTLNSKIIEQKKIEDIDFITNKDNNINNNDLLAIKRKSNSFENKFNIIEENKNKKNKNRINKNLKIDNNEEDENNMNIFNKYDLTAQIKIFDQKANSIKEKYKELQRETNELKRISKAENKQIFSLRKQNIFCRDFFKLSQGERLQFIKTRNNSINKDDIQYHYSLKSRISILHKLKNKNNTLVSCPKRRHIFREFYPFNSRYDNYKPYKYDISKSLLVNKKIFEFSIFKKKKDDSCSNNSKNKYKIYKYKSSSDVNIDKFNSIKKKMIVINCQDLYKKMD